MTDKTEKQILEELIRATEARTLQKLEEASRQPLNLPPDDPVLQMIQEVNAIVAADRELQGELGRTPSHEEIARRTGIPPERVAEARRVAPPPVTIDE